MSTVRSVALTPGDETSDRPFTLAIDVGGTGLKASVLSQTGTVILKFMLHIGLEEQGKRLQDRIDDPSKHWKFSMGDLEVRKQWPQYQKAYEALLNATSTPWAPWTVVPANSKTHRNLMIATVVRSALQQLDLRFPPRDPALAGLKIMP